MMTVCRACKGSNLFCYLPLGAHPAANAFVKPGQTNVSEAVFPLDTYVCLDCALIQVADQLPPDFYVDYLYVPSGSSTMPKHFQTLAQRFKNELITGVGQRVVDIGCNDALLLAACREIGLETLGIDPAANIAALARAKGVEVFNEYFTAESAARVREKYGPAQVIVTTNTFNHIDNLHGFMRGVDVLLAEGGTFVIEAPQALTCVEHNEFDTVYHEHLSVFSVASVAALGRVVGMEIANIEELPIHGGSMRLYLRRGKQNNAIVEDWLQRERDARLFERETYVAHAARVEAIKVELNDLLARLKAEGKSIAGYGAPAKGNTLLNYFKIGPETLDFIADRNALKHGRLTPGMHVPIVGPDAIELRNPDYLLVLAWNFLDEILEQQAEFKKRGGKFIVPIPNVRII
jgi:SAM-dependent methyltransferase